MSKSGTKWKLAFVSFAEEESSHPLGWYIDQSYLARWKAHCSPLIGSGLFSIHGMSENGSLSSRHQASSSSLKLLSVPWILTACSSLAAFQNCQRLPAIRFLL